MLTGLAVPNDKTPVGAVRPSQLLWTYGPGALIDLPGLSVVTLGLDKWERDQCRSVTEARLLAAVRRVLGPQVTSLRIPPFQREEIVDPFSLEAFIGVPVKPFPRWLRCVKCGLLSEYDIGLIECKENLVRPELTRFVHKGCKGSKGDQPAKDADAVPARFLIACRAGHLDDFPWHFFVHIGKSECRGSLRFFEAGASLQTENLWVKCDDCGASRNMAQAFGRVGKNNLPSCRGRHPHTESFDEQCDQEPKAVLLGASNTWFPTSLSALAIPITKDPVSQLVQDGWDYFKDKESPLTVSVTVETLITAGILPGLGKHSKEAIWAAVETIRNDEGAGTASEADIKGPEWEVLIDPNPPIDWPHFLSTPVAPPAGFEKQISGVLLLERLREVNALLGFTRVEAPEENSDTTDGPDIVSLSHDAPDWALAGEVHGEGIFIRFDEAELQRWVETSGVKQVDEQLFQGHRGWRNRRKLDQNKGYPGVRFALLHTLSHVLIRELALECGYNAASIRERIYSDVESGRQQAGILIYTAAADSDGTLGGLVELGKPANLGRLLVQALERTRICSSDPLCAEHDPHHDQSLHRAACHACAFVAETSCETQNRYLDRALLIPTLYCNDAAFFD